MIKKSEKPADDCMSLTYRVNPKSYQDTKAIKMNPKYAMAYNNRGVAYYHKGEYDKAWEDVRKAQSLGHQVRPRFLKSLREASGREK